MAESSINWNDMEAWRQVPPEVKLELMTSSHTHGFLVAGAVVLLSGTLAIGFTTAWVFWGGLIGAPLIFQLVAGRTWRRERPQIILRYLAARSAARRYAYAHHAEDLTLQIILEGKVKVIQTRGEQAMDMDVDTTPRRPVWIAVFTDTLVILEEGKGGATPAVIQFIDERMTITTNYKENDPSRPIDSVEISFTHKQINSEVRCILSSPYSGALFAFEGMLRFLQKKRMEQRAALREAIANPSTSKPRTTEKPRSSSSDAFPDDKVF